MALINDFHYFVLQGSQQYILCSIDKTVSKRFINSSVSSPQKTQINKQLGVGMQLKEIMRTIVKYCNSA